MVGLSLQPETVSSQTVSKAPTKRFPERYFMHRKTCVVWVGIRRVPRLKEF
jgi:hypothetical protein